MMKADGLESAGEDYPHKFANAFVQWLSLKMGYEVVPVVEHMNMRARSPNYFGELFLQKEKGWITRILERRGRSAP
jgi:hypothetical protein